MTTRWVLPEFESTHPLRGASWLVLGGVGLMWLCQRPPAPAPPSVVDDALRHYATADFFKPAPSDGQVADLAPLLLFEVAQDFHQPLALAALTWRAEHGWVYDDTTPTVYAGRDVWRHGATEYDQIMFAWLHPHARGAACGAVRATVANDGLPVLWETFGTAPPDVVFAVERLESAARAAFGKPPAGRRYALEGEDSATVVARVIADGPTPVGPWVYVDARRRQVSTLLCRCMPSQVDEFSGMHTYELAPLENLVQFLSDAAAPEELKPLVEWLTQSGRPALDRLRLPDAL